MAQYPYTGSILTNSDGTNKISTSLSVHYLIKNDKGITVGALQTMSIHEQGGVEQVTEIGTDGVLNTVRNTSVKISGSCQRVRYSRLRGIEAFGQEYTHIHSQAAPFDIWIYDRQGAQESDWVITVIGGIWMESSQWKLDHQNWIVTDDLSFKASAIKSWRGGANQFIPAAQGGDGAIKLSHLNVSDGTTGAYSVQQAADMGLNNRRGALDIAGLSNATLF